ncbi:MAG: outer membrane protein [Acidobacteriota bacterium]|nr:outer membrane protein [Acidobacteriota bacterium]
MSRLRYLLLVAAVVFPIMAAAQQPSNDVGVWVSTSQFDKTSETDPDLGGEVSIEFDENIGYGVTFSHYWGNALAVEFGAQKLGGDLNLSVEGPGAEFTAKVGELDLQAYSATLQWHFARGSRVSPYIGGGAAFVTADFDAEPLEDEPAEQVDLDNETTWLANAGVNIALTPSLSLGIDGKYIAYEPKGEGDTDDDRLDVNPLVLSAGLRFRF